MAYTINYGEYGETGSSGTSITVDTSLSGTKAISAGELLICWCSWNGADTTVSLGDGGSNTFTFLSKNTSSNSTGVFGYVLAAEANASPNYVMTLGAARSYRSCSVFKASHAANKISEFDVQDITDNFSSGTSHVSGAISTAGPSLVFGGLRHEQIDTSSSHKIGGVDDDWKRGPSWSMFWYVQNGASQSNITATATSGTSGAGLTSIMAINEVDDAVAPTLSSPTVTSITDTTATVGCTVTIS